MKKLYSQFQNIAEHPTQVTDDVQIEKKEDKSDAKNSSKWDGEREKADIESRVQKPETSAGDGVCCIVDFCSIF